HEGERALAWRWFVEQHDTLEDGVARLGWPTDDVLWLYDRVEGRMVGFCTVGSSDGCVDLPTLLDSLVDPNALGLGDCALSGMVAAGVRGPAGSARYACPSACSTPTAPTTSPLRPGSVGKGFPTRPSGPPPSIRSQLPWSNVTSSDVSTMQGYCGSTGGGAAGGGSGGGGSAGGQGPGLRRPGSLQQGPRKVPPGPRDPRAPYAPAVRESAGANPEP